MMQTLRPYPLLARSLKDAPIIDRAGYDYFVHPLSDGIPRVDPALLGEAADGLVRHLADVRDGLDVLVTAEAMGLPLAAAVSLRTGIPFVTVRKRAYGLPGERVLDQRTGYSQNALHLNDIRAGDRVAVLDDVISTGGTLRALAEGLQAARADLRAVVAVFTKDPDLSAWQTRLGCPVRALLCCSVRRDDGAKRVVVDGTDLGLQMSL